MRDNYSEHGVDEYYRKVGATYRNPHFPGIRQCIFIWLNIWWNKEGSIQPMERFTFFDMACGSGEAAISLMEWWKSGQLAYVENMDQSTTAVSANPTVVSPKRKETVPSAPPLAPDILRPRILASDPYTAEAFKARTTLECSTASFSEIAEGALDRLCGNSQGGQSDGEPSVLVDMTVCSFALHLIDSPSELFSLLWELSTKSRWLIILAPHKKPDIKNGWGWTKWDAENWTECPMSQSSGEFLQDRVHCRIYRSLNC